MSGNFLPDAFKGATDLGVFDFEVSNFFSRKMVFDNAEGTEVKDFYIGCPSAISNNGFNSGGKIFTRKKDFFFLTRAFRPYSNKLKGFSCLANDLSVYQEPLKYIYSDNERDGINISKIDWSESIENDEFNPFVQHFKCDIFLNSESALIFSVHPGKKLSLTFYLERL